jgi:hypothetical protein
MRLKIVCDGNAHSTQIVNADTGEPVENVMGIEVSIDSFNVEAVILIKDVPVEINNLEAKEILTGETTEGNV